MGADGMGRNGTAANIQLGPDHHFAGGGAEAVDGVQQDLHGPIPDVLAGDIYGSERRIRQSGKWKSVKADLPTPWFTVYPDPGNLTAWGSDVASELTLGARRSQPFI